MNAPRKSAFPSRNGAGAAVTKDGGCGADFEGFRLTPGGPRGAICRAAIPNSLRFSSGPL